MFMLSPIRARNSKTVVLLGAPNKPVTATRCTNTNWLQSPLDLSLDTYGLKISLFLFIIQVLFGQAIGRAIVQLTAFSSLFGGIKENFKTNNVLLIVDYEPA